MNQKNYKNHRFGCFGQFGHPRFVQKFWYRALLKKLVGAEGEDYSGLYFLDNHLLSTGSLRTTHPSHPAPSPTGTLNQTAATLFLRRHLLL